MVNLEEGHFIQDVITAVAAASLDVAFLIPTPSVDNKFLCFPLNVLIQDGSRREFRPGFEKAELGLISPKLCLT